MTNPDHNPVLPKARRAGVCLHLTSLPGPHGIGEIGAEACGFLDALTRMGMAVWQFLPVGPTAYGDSPYQPLSTFAGNELLISMADLVRRRLLQPAELTPLEELPAGRVDYGRLVPLKNALLMQAAERFPECADARQKVSFDEFLHRHDALWLHDYALFRILKARHDQRPWPDWEAAFRHRDDHALKTLERKEAKRIVALKTVQFLFHDQWRRLRTHAKDCDVRLFGDLPIYIALDSADAWAHPELLRLDRDGQPDAVAGVPPDYFSADGQLWGNPLYDWPAHTASDYRWWCQRMRASMALADIVRIDHFRGFESYWAVPADAETARSGSWEPGPGDAIFDAMKKALNTLPIVAEDLGVITPEVEALRERQGVPGMVVLQFCADDPDFTLESVRDHCVCYTGTHDNDTTLGWFRGSPNDNRGMEDIERTRSRVLELTGGTTETIAHDLIRSAFSTNARLAIAPMQDYLGLGSEARFNTPGTTGNNWCWRLDDAQLCERLIDRIARTVGKAGRS